MRPVRATICGLTVLMLLLLAAQVRADGEPEIAVEASASEIFMGESIDYVVEVRNVKSPSAPNLSGLREDFSVATLGDESRNQSSTLIINGRVTQKSSFGHVYRYRLIPKRTGSLTIPAPTVTVDGSTISGRDLSLKVVAPEPQDLVVAEIKTSRTRVYPTQPFDVTLRVLVHPLPDEGMRDPLTPLRRRPPRIEVNWVDPPNGLTGEDKARWLQNQLSDDGVGFALNDFTVRSISIFGEAPAAVFKLSRGREARKGLDGQSVNYWVYELKRTLTAEKAGTYTFGPAPVKGAFVSGRDGSNYTGQRLVAIATATQIEVRDVPTPRPATFCGGIGNYQLVASAKPTALRVGDPMTLTLEIERQAGSGSLDLISAPDLASNAQLASDFEIIDRSPTGRSEGDVKRFDYALRPKRSGVSIPQVAVSVFNPDNEKFSEVATKPITLAVTAGSRVAAGDLVGALGSSGKNQIQSRAQGIFQSVTDPSEVFDERVNVMALAGVAAGSWLALVILLGVASVHRRKSGDVVWQRRRSARRAAERRLAEARKYAAEGQSRESLRAVRSALIGVVADMRNIVAEGLTASEADDALAQTSISADERAKVARLLEAIESAEYGSGRGAEVPAMIEQAAAMIPALARQLERSA
jgi:hypothetical protein